MKISENDRKKIKSQQITNKILQLEEMICKKIIGSNKDVEISCCSFCKHPTRQDREPSDKFKYFVNVFLGKPFKQSYQVIGYMTADMERFNGTITDNNPQVNENATIEFDFKNGEVKNCNNFKELMIKTYNILKTNPENMQRMQKINSQITNTQKLPSRHQKYNQTIQSNIMKHKMEPENTIIEEPIEKSIDSIVKKSIALVFNTNEYDFDDEKNISGSINFNQIKFSTNSEINEKELNTKKQQTQQLQNQSYWNLKHGQNKENFLDGNK